MLSPNPIPMLILIDDDEVDQMLYRRAIDQSAIVNDFRTFLSANDALIYLRESNRPFIDAILVDMNMPGMSGLEFLEMLKIEWGATVTKLIVMLCSVPLIDEDIARLQALELGVEFVDKPVRSEDLLSIASRLMTIHQS